MTAPTHIRQVAITVESVDACLPFYRDVLGLPFLFQPAPSLAFLQCGQTRLMLTTPQGAGEPGKNSILYFYVTDIEAAFTQMCERGAAVERPPALAAQMPDHALWTGFLRDPEGNLVGLMEEKPL